MKKLGWFGQDTGQRWNKLRTGSKSSACPSTPSVPVEIRIDVSVLPDLTDQDLEKLGVLLGDRRKMMRAIRDLRTAPITADRVASQHYAR